MKAKEITLALFPEVTFSIYLVDKLSDLNEITGQELPEGQAITLSNGKDSIMLGFKKDKTTHADIVHEVFHAVNYLFGIVTHKEHTQSELGPRIGELLFTEIAYHIF